MNVIENYVLPEGRSLGLKVVFWRDDDVLWFAVEYETAEAVDVKGKVKVPKCKTIAVSSDRKEVVSFIQGHTPEEKRGPVLDALVVEVEEGDAEIGDNGIAIAGDKGRAEAGDHGSAIAGDKGHAKAGDYGSAIVRGKGTATAGDYGTAIAGKNGTAMVG